MLEGNPIRGNSWEGYVIEQISFHARDRYGLYFYRAHQGAECDLVVTIANRPVMAAEIKYTAAPRIGKGLRIAIEDLGTMNNYIVCLCDEDYPITENITVCKLENFIMKYLNVSD